MTNITQGFSEPVHQAQHVFRRLLDAMSRPGKLQQLDAFPAFGDAGAAATQILLALADHSTPLWLSAAFKHDETLLANIRFHMTSPMVEESQDAIFSLISGHEQIALASFNLGDEAYPELSTTVLVEVESLTEGRMFRLSGPGVKGSHDIHIQGLSDDLLKSLLERDVRDMLGVDVVLTCGQALMTLPRTTSVKLMNDKEQPCTSQ